MTFGKAYNNNINKKVINTGDVTMFHLFIIVLLTDGYIGMSFKL